MVLRFGTAFWTIPVILAGKLLTNEVVYGEFMHFDIYLYKFWNLIKNIANYLLAFLFIVKVFFLIKQGGSSIMSEVSKILKGVMIAAVLIQISWRIVGMLIDLSSLGIATVASLPSQIVSSNADYKKNFETALDQSYGRSINFDNHEMQSLDTNIAVGTTPAQDNTAYFFMNKDLDKLLPTYDNVSGPLMIMGMSMMKFMDWYKHPSTTMTCTNIALSTLFRAIILTFYLIPIIVLLLVSIFRIFKLWIYITFSPLIALFYGLQQAGSNDIVPSAVQKYVNDFSMGNMLTLIFQPVMIVWALSIWIILLIAMYATFALWSTSGSTTYKFTDESFMVANGTIAQFKHNWNDEFILQWSFVTDNVATTPVGYIIVSIMTIMVLRAIVKLAISEDVIGRWILSDRVDKWTDLLQDTMTSIPLVPLPSVGALSINNLNQIKSRVTNKMNTRWIEKMLNIKNDREATKFAEMFGIDKTNQYDITNNEKASMGQTVAQHAKDNILPIKNKSLSFDTLHKQNKDIFGQLSQYTQDKKLTLGQSSNLKNAIYQRFVNNNGKHYLQAIWVLDTSEAQFKNQEGNILDDQQIANKFFNFTNIQKGTSQSRLVQFITMAMNTPDIWQRITKTMEKINTSKKSKIVDLANDTQHIEQMIKQRKSVSDIVTSNKDDFNENMLNIQLWTQKSTTATPTNTILPSNTQ
jgi:hypothetical protein